MKKRLLLLFLVGAAKLCAVDSWYEDKRRGWYYFEDSPQKEEQEEGTFYEELSPQEAQAAIESAKQKTNELLCQALLQPTEEHVAAYLKHQQYLIGQSAKFASTWKSVLLSHPEWGYALPQTDYASKLKQIQESMDREKRLEQVKATHFLVFFFRGGDLFSQEASEIVARLNRHGDWKVEAVSLDGKGVEAFSSFERDRGLATQFGVQQAPALYLVDPQESRVVPIANGLLDYESIEKNIDFQTRRQRGEAHAL